MQTIIGWLIKIYNQLLNIKKQNDIIINLEKQNQHVLGIAVTEVVATNSRLDVIEKVLGIGVAVELKLKFTFEGVEIMPIQITDKQAVVVTPGETDAVGNPTTVDPTQMSYGVSDPTAFTIQSNSTASPVTAPDGQVIPPGGAWYQAKQEAGHLGAFQATSADAANNINAQDTITVVGSAATALTMNFATPA